MKRVISCYLDEFWVGLLDESATKIGMFRSALMAGMLREKIQEVYPELNPLEEIQASLPQVGRNHVNNNQRDRDASSTK